MAQISSLLNLQGQLAMLMIVGALLWKLKIMDERSRKFLTDLVIDLVLPANIIQSFRMEFNLDIFKSTFVIIVTSATLQLVSILIAKWGFLRMKPERKPVMQYGTICSNAGFLGNPVVEGIFGSSGMLLGSVFLIPQRIVMWSLGIGYFMPQSANATPEEKKVHRRKVLRQTLTHPCIIAAELGILIMVFQIPLPGFLGTTVKSISNCNTALSMILIGGIMAGGDFHNLFEKDAMVYCLWRLGIIPLILLVICRVCGVAPLVTGVTVVLAAMPMGGTTAILAAKYGADAPFAAKCIAMSTVLSLITTPLWCLVL